MGSTENIKLTEHVSNYAPDYVLPSPASTCHNFYVTWLTPC